MINLVNKIPFLDTILSNENFNEIKSFENYNLKIEKIQDRIEISYKLTYSTNVFIYEYENKYWLTLNPNNLYKKFGKEINLIRYKYFYKKLILTKDNYKFIIDDNELYSIPLDSYKGLQILKNWINKYTKLIQQIPQENLIIEMSAGIDTRVLSYFWRNTNNSYYIYTKQRQTEYQYACNVISYINENFPVNLNQINNLDKLNIQKPIIKLNGSNIIHGLNKETKLLDFYDIINNPLSNQQKFSHINRDIVPYYDKEYLKLRLRYPGQLKIILIKLLCEEKELYKLPIISFKQQQLNLNQINETYMIDKIKKIINN